MPIRAPEGYLDITNATLRASEIVTTSNVGIANANPTNTLSIGSNVFFEDTSSNAMTVRGNVVAEGIKLGFLQLLPSYDLELTANVGNSISNTVQFTNSTTGFITSSNVGIGTNAPDGLVDVGTVFKVKFGDLGATAADITDGYNTVSITESAGTYTYTRDTAANYGNFLPTTALYSPITGRRYRVKLTARSDYTGSIRLENPANGTVIASYDLTTSFTPYEWEFTATATTMYFRATITTGTTLQFNAFSMEVLEATANTDVIMGGTRFIKAHDASKNFVAIGPSAGATAQGSYAIAVGSTAGNNNQGESTVAVGRRAGETSQGNNAIAVGLRSGLTAQGNNAVAVGQDAGVTAQGASAVAVGVQAGLTSQGASATAVGDFTGRDNQGDSATAVGIQAGRINQGTRATAVGRLAGQTSQGDNAVAMGNQAGQISQGVNAIAMGNLAGNTSQGTQAVAVGYLAAETSQGTESTAVGYTAARYNQGESATAVGRAAGLTSQGDRAVAIGRYSGSQEQGSESVAVGYGAGETSQGIRAIAMGYFAGENEQTGSAIAMGNEAGRYNQGANAVAVGLTAGQTSQGTYGTAVGPLAGRTSQGNYATAVGNSAGLTSQGTESTAVGTACARYNQGNYATAVGRLAGETSQSSYATAVGNAAGLTAQGNFATAVGNEAGKTTQGAGAVAAGNLAGAYNQGNNAVAAGGGAGQTSQGDNAVAVGLQAGNTNQGSYATAVGYAAGRYNQGTYPTAMGWEAGRDNQGNYAVAVGYSAGRISQSFTAVAIGSSAGNMNQGSNAIAVGRGAGQTSQGINATAVGNGAGQTSQGDYAIAVGRLAGENSQGVNSIAFGQVAGQYNQAGYAIAVGYSPGVLSQGDYAIAVGFSAARNFQGSNSIALGLFAGCNNQGSYCIALGTGAGRYNQTANSFRVSTNSVRNANGNEYLHYNNTSGEVSKGNNYSDDRLKYNEKIITGAIKSLFKLRPEEYDKKPSLKPSHAGQNWKRESGLIAQEIYYSAPEFRHTVQVPQTAGDVENYTPPPSDDPNQDPDYSVWGEDSPSVDYKQFVPYLIKGVQEIVTELPRSKTTVSNAWGQNITGLVVSANANAHKTNTTPIVALSNVYMDKKWYGVVSEKKTDTNDYDTLIDTKGDTQIWVTDVGGPLESGDLVTTSNVAPGYAQKQGDDLLRSSTVAKVTQDCDFTEPTQRPIRVPKRELSNVTYYLRVTEQDINLDAYEKLFDTQRKIKTTPVYVKEVDENEQGGEEQFFHGETQVSEEKYKTLPEDERSKKWVIELEVTDYEKLSDEEKAEYTLGTRERWFVLTTTKSKASIPEHDEEVVVQEMVDVLDENGQIVWEETGETEPVYTLVDYGSYKAALVSAKLV